MKGWTKYKLSEAADLIAGFAFKSTDFGDYNDVVVKIKDIQPPYVITKNTDKVNLTSYDKYKLRKFILVKGDFVLAMTGATIGKVGKYIDDNIAYLNQRVLKFVPYENFNPQFIYYILLTSEFQNYVRNHIDSESAQANISAKTIGKYEFKAPSLEEQNKIATILSSLDDKIELNRRINDNLTAIA